MDFAFSDDQQQLREAARRLLAERLPDDRLHAAADGVEPHDRALWSELVGLGWVGVSGAAGGGTFLDEAVLLEEAGFALAPVPLLSGVLALPVLEAVGADLTRPSAIAWAEPSGLTAFAVVGSPACTATSDAGGAGGTGARAVVTGRKVDVADGPGAEQLVVVASAGSGGPAHPFVTPVPAPGVEVTTQPTLDGTRRIGTVDLTAAEVHSPAPAGSTEADTLLRSVRRRALAGLALESVGVAQRALDLAAAHAGQREQFGRVIGTYQAVSHRIADVYVRTELARSLAYRAAWFVATAETDPGEVAGPEVDSACSAAKAAAGEAAVFACESLVQVLGGIGMTWQHVAHRFYKRALADRAYGGGPAQHRAAVAAVLLDA